MTSAPIQASSWLHVGPAWTCVMSRMRTPSSAFIVSLPLLFLPRGRIQAGYAATFGARGLIDDGVDERRLARAHRFFHGLAQFGRRRGMGADAAEGFDQLVVAGVLDEHGGRRIAAIGIDVGALVDAVVVHH